MNSSKWMNVKCSVEYITNEEIFLLQVFSFFLPQHTTSENTCLLSEVMISYAFSHNDFTFVYEPNLVSCLLFNLYKGVFKRRKKNVLFYSQMSFQRAARTDKGVSAAGNLISLKICILHNLKCELSFQYFGLCLFQEI